MNVFITLNWASLKEQQLSLVAVRVPCLTVRDKPIAETTTETAAAAAAASAMLGRGTEVVGIACRVVLDGRRREALAVLYTASPQRLVPPCLPATVLQPGRNLIKTAQHSTGNPANRLRI